MKRLNYGEGDSVGKAKKLISAFKRWIAFTSNIFLKRLENKNQVPLLFFLACVACFFYLA